MPGFSLSFPHPNRLMIFDASRDCYVRASDETCTARWASPGQRHIEGEICGRKAVADLGDFALCSHHAKRLRAWAREFVQWEQEEQWRRAEQERIERRWDPAGSSVVYYLQRADGLIKIGFSTNLRQRRQALAGDHGSLELLAKHWGDRRTEREMHNRFQEDRVVGEWFRPSPALLRWIARVNRNQQNAAA